MLAIIEALMLDAASIAPEYLMVVGVPELKRLRRPRFLTIRGPGRRD